MKKLTLTLLVCLFTLGINAQSTEGKPVVYIEYFSFPNNVSNALQEALRNKVIEGIKATNKVELRDVASQPELKREEERRKDASAMADATARTSEMRTLGANYIITGDIATMEAPPKKDDKGNIYYKGVIKWTIKVIDASNGTLKSTKSFDHSGLTGRSGETQEKAIASTCDYAKIGMKDFVDEAFPIEGAILKVEDEKGTKAQTVYIDLGNARGISKGQKFTVYLETEIAGETARTEIGALSAQEVISANRTLCKVTKGGDTINKKMKEGQKLIVVSRRAITFLDKI